MACSEVSLARREFSARRNEIALAALLDSCRNAARVELLLLGKSFGGCFVARCTGQELRALIGELTRLDSVPLLQLFVLLPRLCRAACSARNVYCSVNARR